MALILGIETSGSYCSISFNEDGKTIFSSGLFLPNGQAQILVPMIQAGFNFIEKSVDQCSLVAVGKGPGSYTGLRIGASVAAGLCFGLDLPITGISSLENLFHQMKVQSPGYDFYIPAFDARRNEIYFSIFSKDGTQVMEPQAVDLNEIDFRKICGDSSVFLGGDGSLKIMDVYGSPEAWHHDPDFVPEAKITAKIGYQKYLDLDFEKPTHFEPEYVKPVYFSKPNVF
jgi:tRNA threonylcarbamoyladenosine biosynthesis protein TsaB